MDATVSTLAVTLRTVRIAVVIAVLAFVIAAAKPAMSTPTPSGGSIDAATHHQPSGDYPRWLPD
jgi:hypothetical protein